MKKSQSQTKIEKIIESVLLAAGKPLSLPKLFNITGVKQADLKAAVVSLQEKHKKRNSGMQILTTGNAVELVPNPEYAEYTEKVSSFDFEKTLSPASLETLSIVAYRGPISRVEVDQIRGVNSTYALRNLAQRGLLISKRDVEDSRQTTFDISERFLKHMGVLKRNELPNFNELSKKTTFEEYIEEKEKKHQEEIVKAVNR